MLALQALYQLQQFRRSVRPSHSGVVVKMTRNIAENFNNHLSRVHERYRRQTDDGRATANSERGLT